MILNKVNGIINWSDLVGVEILSPNNTKIIATSYRDNKLYIGEWVSDIEGYTNVIVTLNEDRALEQLRLLGYQIDIVDKIKDVYSFETTEKAKGLIQAGFNYLIKDGDNYKVDDIFIQNFLKPDELQTLLNKRINRIELTEIVGQ